MKEKIIEVIELKDKTEIIKKFLFIRKQITIIFTGYRVFRVTGLPMNRSCISTIWATLKPYCYMILKEIQYVKRQPRILYAIRIPVTNAVK